MGQTYILSLDLHLFFVKLILIFMLAHLVLVWLKNKNFAYIKRLMFFLPAYYCVLACIVFSGFLNLALLHFSMNASIVAMLVASVVLIILGAKGFKKLKALRINNNIKNFRIFMSVKILLEMLVIIITTIISVKF
ncbi:MAG: putative membrane protein [Candidatus Campylobacter infans]|nr:MAG: putative membrane protein [Candidatus Campylobacter infans]